MPLLLSLALLLHLTSCGRAVFCLLGLRLGRDRTWLLSPALGLAVVGVPIMLANQAGAPVATFALPLLAFSSALSALVLYRNRGTLGASPGPFLLIGVTALFLAGWPALLYGWNWVGYGNDDMANYCLGADRFLRHGFYAVPSPADLAGDDYSQMFWMLHVAGQIRFGSEHLLAYVAGCTGLKTVEVFLPALLALGLVQLTAFAGLVMRTVHLRRQSLLTALLLGLAPLWYYSLMYQLVAQVAGLALLAAVLALTARTRFPAGLRGRLRIAAAVALLLAGLGIYYPEVLPFFALGWGLHQIMRLITTRRWPAGLLPTACLAGIFTILLLHHNLLSTVLTLMGQVQDGLNSQSTAARVSLFPYFLMPAGPAFFLGFDAIVARAPEPWSSVAVVAGWLGGCGVLFVWLRGLRMPVVSTALLTVMIPVGAMLFRSGNGFGLFKLVMFALPFLAAEAARLASRWRGRTVLVIGALALAVWLPVIWRYTRAATNLSASVVSELFDASVSRGALPTRAAWADTMSSPVNKLLMLEAPAAKPVFISQLVGATILGRAAEPFPPWIWRMIPGEADGETAAALVHQMQNSIYRRERVLGLDFWARQSAVARPGPGLEVITSEAELRAFNKLARHPGSPGLYTYFPYDDLHNHLAFIQTRQGQHYYLGAADSISVYRAQTDSYDAEAYFFAIGRHLLFRVFNPTGTVRVRFNLTATVLGAGRTALPSAAVVRTGENQVQPFDLVGAGSANVFSPPFQPLTVDGISYVALDLGAPPLPVGLPARGLQGAYHRNLSLDTRFALGYCRDISLIDERDYAALPRKRSLERLPTDLMGPDAVEYSGLCEDGWVADRCYVVLGPATAGEQIVVRGIRSELPPPAIEPQVAEIWLDGERVLQQPVALGEFTLRATVRHTRPAVRVELRFAETRPLPPPDNRPVSVLLKSLHLQPAP